MFERKRLSRRDFVKAAAAAGTLLALGQGRHGAARALEFDRSAVLRVDGCPVPDSRMRHRGLDALLRLLAEHESPLYRTLRPHPWGDPDGLIGAADVVLLKVNCQWKCRGTTNTDVVRGLIHRILQHPDGFQGEVVIFENGQGQAAFDGDPRAWDAYAPWPAVDQGIHVNAEEEDTLTVDHLVTTVFADAPVSSYLLDPIRATFIDSTDHATDGYRRVSDVSYPCFTSAGGHRVELQEGLWTGSGHEDRIKLINLPVLKHHDGTGITGALKHTFGILSMWDGSFGKRHYLEAGTQAGKMWTEVRSADLNVVDCIWVSHQSLEGHPVDTTHRANVLLGGTDPVALDYHASKHLLLPLGGVYAAQHDPEASPGLVRQLTAAQDQINANGGLDGTGSVLACQGDENIDVFSLDARTQPSPGVTANGTERALTVGSETPVSIRVQVTAGTAVGQPSDAWILARAPSGWWSYDPEGWQPGLHRYRSGPLRDVPDLQVLNETLPAGTYTFYAVLDDNADGALDATWWDSIRVEVRT